MDDDTAITNLPETSSKSLDEPAVVGSCQDRSGIFGEGVFELREDVEAEVVRWLVEQEDGRLLGKEAGDLELSALAGAEDRHRPGKIFDCEQSIADQLVNRVLAMESEPLPVGVEDCARLAGYVGGLIEITEMDAARDVNVTRRRLKPAGNDIQQSGLTGAVWPDKDDSLSRPDDE